MEINLSASKDNYSQRNNKIKPHSSCNVTSMVMALSYLGYSFPKGSYEQPEDNLRNFIEKADGNPENHYMLSNYTCMWMGKEVTRFSTERSIKSILNELREQRPVVISGTFPGYPDAHIEKQSGEPRPLGHIVCLAGYGWKDGEETPGYVIWDDPYGDTLRNWNGSGNDIRIPYKMFIEWIKPCGNTVCKWGHFFK
jgi:uncharacterized protein YvpB